MPAIFEDLITALSQNLKKYALSFYIVPPNKYLIYLKTWTVNFSFVTVKGAEELLNIIMR